MSIADPRYSTTVYTAGTVLTTNGPVSIPSGYGFTTTTGGFTGGGSIHISEPTGFVDHTDVALGGTGFARLTQRQQQRLLDEHEFIEMENTSYCLLCFALDKYRTEGDHLFVIHLD